jgi:phospholipase C
MMENRSFDHVFGGLSLVEGRTDVDGLLDGMGNPGADGVLVTPGVADINCVADPPHGWDSCHRQFNGGANDGFVTEYAPRAGETPYRVMDFLPRSLQPASMTLADEFALCQRWYASVMGPTWPNRYHFLAGTSHGVKTNTTLGKAVPHLFNRLYKAGVPYGNYYANIPFGVVLDGVSLTDPEMGKHEDFFAKAAAGTLPSVVVIDPIYGRSDDHPPTHPLAGQIFLQSVYDALRTSPQWERSLLVVTYDEHGGFHDHVPPPLVDDDFAADGFDQLGFRVPSYVVGPFVKKAVSDVQFDHTSIYATVAALHGLEPLGTRDANANTLLSLLDEDLLDRDAPRAAPELAPIVADEAEIFAPSCAGLPFHGRADVVGDITGQAELEQVFAQRFPDAARDLRANTEGRFKDLLAHARQRGVWVQR